MSPTPASHPEAPPTAPVSVSHCGRFAPSPTGELHFGSLLAAAGSYLDARAHGGEWLVRMEDLDTPRNVPGAADAILGELERLGMRWDGEVVRQSDRLERYRAAFERLRRDGHLFACGCSRREVAGGIYPGTCRDGLPPHKQPRSWRMRAAARTIVVEDRVQGAFRQRLDRDVGDFVVLRSDRIFAYHLAVVVDDAAQAVSHVVRGADLLDSTPRQIHLLECLGERVPVYAHLPVIVDDRGRKLSKQTGAEPVGRHPPGLLVLRALEQLGQQPPADLAGEAPDVIWAWAIASWRIERIPRGGAVPHRALATGET